MPDIFIATSEQSGKNPKHQLSKENNPTRYISRLASFFEKPDGVSFQNQEEDEKILLFLRPHFITNLPWIFITLVLMAIPPLFLTLNSQFSILNLNALPARFTTIFTVFYYLIILNYIFISFITWFYNVSLVTQKRIVDIDFSDLVYHDVAITKLSLIEDINYAQSGFIRSFFNYGDVFVQTAGEKTHFDFLATPKPGKVVDIIQNLIGRRHDVR